MSLRDVLERERKVILKDWAEQIIESYPADSQGFLKDQSNPFGNPVGASIREGTAGVFDALTADADLESDDVVGFLDRVIRVRAVQEFTAAQAVQFVFLLKYAIRRRLGREILDRGMFEELLTFETRIDKLALLSFNIFTQCREKIYEIRATELRNRTSRVLERAAQIWQSAEDGGSDLEHND